jgi:hypothetical protein
MKKTYMSPVVEELFVETAEIIAASDETLKAFTGSEDPELDNEGVLSRGFEDFLSGDASGVMDIFK